MTEKDARQSLQEKYDRIEEIIQERSTQSHILEHIIRELPALHNQLRGIGIPTAPNHPVFSTEEEQEKSAPSPHGVD